MGCLVAYVLKITDIDPLSFGLLFERMLNLERVSPPDFDVDFCMRRRSCNHARDKYYRTAWPISSPSVPSGKDGGDLAR